MIFRARQFEFRFPRPALIMGVVNVTPDSFSDGGEFLEAPRAVARALQLVEQGADLLDIGGESTRPGATPVGEAEELRRVLPVIEQLAGDTKVPLSIDTMKPAVARAALAVGASIVNDVAANRADDAMGRVVAETGAGYIAMHMQGQPQTMQANPVYANVVRAVADFFRERLQRLNGCGVGADQVVFDVGIGFGKTLEHNLQLLAALRSFTKLERPLVLGVSRKSFIGQLIPRRAARPLSGATSAALRRGFTPTAAAERLPGSLACACLAVEAGVQIIRTHDVAETAQAVRMTEAILTQKNGDVE
jgi:dihydropteroate synthase